MRDADTMHRLIAAYKAGRDAYPNEPNPYPQDLPAARMWRLGWQQTRDKHHGTPNPPSTELDNLKEKDL